MKTHKQARFYRRASQGEPVRTYAFSLKPSLIAQVDKLAHTQQVSRSEMIERLILHGIQQAGGEG